MSDRGGKSTVKSAILERMRQFRESDQGAEVQIEQFSWLDQRGRGRSPQTVSNCRESDRSSGRQWSKVAPTAGKVIGFQGVSGPKGLQLQGK